MDFNIFDEVRKMLEIIDRSKKARQFAYCVVILAFIFGMVWALHELINAIRWW